MYAVLEEIEGKEAILIPDSNVEPIRLALTDLPDSYSIGDVFLVENRKQQWVIKKNDATEKEKRLRDSRKKREQLLKRTRSERD